MHDAVALRCFDPTTVGTVALSLQGQSLFPLEKERMFKTFFFLKFTLCVESKMETLPNAVTGLGVMLLTLTPNTAT